jgi:hypothetical protein
MMTLTLTRVRVNHFARVTGADGQRAVAGA